MFDDQKIKLTILPWGLKKKKFLLVNPETYMVKLFKNIFCWQN